MAGRVYLTVPEVAKQFGVTPATIYRMVQRGALPAFKIGNQWRFSRPLLEVWVTDQITAGSHEVSPPNGD